MRIKFTFDSFPHPSKATTSRPASQYAPTVVRLPHYPANRRKPGNSSRWVEEPTKTGRDLLLPLDQHRGEDDIRGGINSVGLKEDTMNKMRETVEENLVEDGEGRGFTGKEFPLEGGRRCVDKIVMEEEVEYDQVSSSWLLAHGQWSVVSGKDF